MNKHARRFVTACGMCVITVSLFSGCATHPDATRIPMATIDLNHFQVDCRVKDQQVAMLQAMRQTPNEQFGSRMRAMNPFVWTSDHDVAYNNPNKYINYHLNNLRYCP
jgi:hypothetical protein